MHSQDRLAIFIPALYGGGAERTMLNLAHGIADRGYKVDLILAQAEGPYMSEIHGNIRIVDLGKGRIVDRNRTLKRLPSLVQYLREEQPTALLSALSRANLAAVWARKLAGSPKRVVINEQNTVSKVSANSTSRVAHMAPFIYRYFYRWADSVIGVSKGVVDDLVQAVGVPQRLVKVIFNPGITPELREKAQAPLDHPWFQEGEPPVILAVGSLTVQKDFPTLLRAFAQIRRNRLVRLLILGEGPERKKLEELVTELSIDEDVSIPGFVDNPYPYMVRASVFTLSSLWEGLPTVLVEALYCGAPIVATDCPSGPREILRNGDIGRLVPVGDPKALAESITEAVDGKVPRPPVESWQPYTIEKVVDQYIDVLLTNLT